MILLFALFCLLILTLIIKYNNNNGFIPQELDNLKYYDENNNIIYHKIFEREEQYMAYEYIEPNDVVLELGGRYGTVSNVINHKLNNKKNHVVVEPDSIVIPALTKNKQQYEYYIENSYISNKNKKIIGNGYGKMMVDSDEQNNKITYSDFKLKYPLKFNVIVADCEGCICEFLDIMGDDLNNINKLLLEEDQPQICDYKKLKNKLLLLGFKQKINGFRSLYIK